MVRSGGGGGGGEGRGVASRPRRVRTRRRRQAAQSWEKLVAHAAPAMPIPILV